MNNKELIRCALMGDKQAQEECTAKGIVLPCPFCGNENNIISNWGMFRVWCPHCKAKSEDTLTTRDALKSWNARPAPPIGRCKDCINATNPGSNIVFCDYFEPDMMPDDFCSCFEPREE
jgi:Lar family restriction alleviation protein